MIVLPIVDRELRVAARRQATYRTRLWAALAAMVLATWTGLRFAWQGGGTASQGHVLFYTLSGLALLYCLCIGARVTSDCLSEEKREGTLGLLFLTDLKGIDVVLGKLVASSLDSFYGLFAVFPLLAMTLLLGGVTLQQFGQMVLVLLNAMFFSLTVGMFVSALSRNERKAIFATLLVVFGTVLLPFAVVLFIVTVLEWVQNPSDVARILPWLMANPFYPFLHALPRPALPFIAFPPGGFWASLGVVHLASWALLGMTALILPRIWKDRIRVVKPAQGPGLVERWQTFARGNSEQRRALRAELLERNPFLWLVSRDRLKPAYAWFFLASMIAVWLWGYYQHRDVMFDFYPLAPTILMVHGFLKVWVVTEVSHRMVEDRRNGALELLFSTPLTTEDMVRGQNMALVRQFARPVLILAMIELAVFQSTYPVRQLLPVIIMLVVDLFALQWIALRLSLSARGINEVLLKSLGLVLVLPTALTWLTFPTWQSFMRQNFGRRWRGSFDHQLYYWFVIGLAIDLLLVLLWARPQLITQMRDAITRWARALRLAIGRWFSFRLRPET